MRRAEASGSGSTICPSTSITFEKFKGREVHVVEIGIYRGGSLDMWKEYFAPKARIY